MLLHWQDGSQICDLVWNGDHQQYVNKMEEYVKEKNMKEGKSFIVWKGSVEHEEL